MTRIYFDTSAVTKLVIAEEESGSLRSWMRRRRDRKLITSSLARAELIRAVRPAGPGAVALASAQLDVMTLMAISDTLLDEAGRLGPARLRSLDAIHVASAMACGSELEAVVTYDRRMAEAARSVGLPVAHPGRKSLAERQ